MKKIVLSIAGVMAAAAFAPEASALPLFARQTGMACSACHFQHFPMLNGFGRSFKASAFTMMGAQNKVEGDKLSLPETLNMAVLTTAGYVKTNAPGATAALTAAGLNNAGNGTVYVPGTNGEFSLFIGGRTSEFSGALAEVVLLNGAAGNGSGISSVKIPMLWSVGDARVGVVPFTTASQGASYGFEELNTGANAVHTMMFAGGDINGSIVSTLSAQQYLGTNGNATGAALVANSDMGFINVTKYHQAGPVDLRGGTAALSPALGGVTGAKLGSTYLRVAGTFDLAGWDTGVGIQSWSGSSFNALNIAAPVISGTKAFAIDGQMQGELGGMPVGFYASYASAPVIYGAGGNMYNNGGALAAVGAGLGVTAKKSSFNISAEVGVLPEVATIGLGIRRGKSGTNTGSGLAGANDTDNAWLLAGTYKLQQNLLLQLVYTKQSGTFYNSVANQAMGTTQTAFNLATLF